MAHIHLPEGTLPLLWAAVWWIAAVVAVAVCLYWLRNVRKMDNRLITLAAMCTAAAFAVFQIEIPLFGGVHLNLTPLIGILVGPAVGGLIMLIVNIFSAAIGHGGWGLIGANTLVNLAEVTLAYYIYRWFERALKASAFASAGMATLAGLLAGNALMIAIIIVSGIQGVENDPVSMLYGLSLIAAVNMGVAVVESLVTGYIVSYIQRVKPEMIRGEKA